MTNVQYNLLYSIYSLPNIFICLFAGVVVDKMGVRQALFAIIFMAFIGQLLFALSAIF